MITAQFFGLNLEGISLDDIVPTGASVAENEADSEGVISIQVLNKNGVAEATYNYYNFKHASNSNKDKHGWYLGKNLASDVTFEPGQGLWVQGSENEVALQQSGAIRNEDVAIRIGSGFTAVGNPFPVAVALNDLVLIGDTVAENGADSQGVISIQVLNKNGVAEATYNYYNFKHASNSNKDKHGWYLGKNLVSDVTFEAGQGLWIQGSDNEVYIQFPNPLSDTQN